MSPIDQQRARDLVKEMALLRRRIEHGLRISASPGVELFAVMAAEDRAALVELFEQGPDGAIVGSGMLKLLDATVVVGERRGLLVVMEK